jgi:hypothetical protein
MYNVLKYLDFIKEHKSTYAFKFPYINRPPLEIPRRTLEDNIKMDLREIEWGGVDWIHLDQDRDYGIILVNRNEHSGS